jgi:hypothetical protein
MAMRFRSSLKAVHRKGAETASYRPPTCAPFIVIGCFDVIVPAVSFLCALRVLPERAEGRAGRGRGAGARTGIGPTFFPPFA